MTDYKKINEYTLSVRDDVLGTEGHMTRVFNFAAATVTTIYREKAEMSEKRGYESAPAVAVSVALTSQLHIHKFSDFDSDAEIELMRQQLVRLGGRPPQNPVTLAGKRKLTVAAAGQKS